MDATVGLQNSKRMTEGRLSGADPRILEHLDGMRLRKDQSLGRVRQHLQIDMAHTVMLAEQGILTSEQAGAILAALREGYELGDAFPIEAEFDTLALQIERWVIARAGEDVGGRMHIGRSRIDLSAAIERLAARDAMLRVHEGLLSLASTTLEIAKDHVNTIMPGWTHLQHAQPWTYGHYLARNVYAWDRHLSRVEAAFERTNMSSLGGAALAGTSWPLNRQRVADLLGHEGFLYNSMDAGETTLDWIGEDLAVLTLLMVDLGRVASDLYLWHSWEFGLAEVDDAFCGSSSIMPQKKNAKSLEWIRGWAGRAVGWFPSSVGVMRSASSTDVDPVMVGHIHILDDAADIAWRTTDMTEGVLSTLQLNTARMAETADAHWSTASDLADSIVREADISFRESHRIVARLVRNAVGAGVGPKDVTSAMLDAAATDVGSAPLALGTEWIQDHLGAAGFIASRVTPGCANASEMAKQFADLDARLHGHAAWRSRKVDAIGHAQAALRAAVDSIAVPAQA